MNRRIRRRRGENTRSVHLPAPETPPQRPFGLPVWRSSAWGFGDSAEYADAFEEKGSGHTYGRIDNPTTAAFASAVASLEGAAAPEDVAGQAFASGMAAVNAVLMTFLRAGAHLVAPTPLYGGTHSLITNVLSRFGVGADFVGYGDLTEVRAAIRPNTKIIYAETLSNPTMAVSDIRGLYRIARAAGALLVVDSTFATPIVCRPLEHGADLVIHSATKYLGGHDDCAGGVAVGRPDLIAQLREVRIDTGGTLSPDDAFLLRRGLATLPLRVRRMCSTAMVFAAAVAKHPAVRRVDYPGLPEHPGHQLARHLFDSGPEGTRYGACVTITPRGGYDAGVALADALRLASIATSAGGIHTKAAHVASTTHRRAGKASGIDEAAVRFSIGLEDAEDLIMDVTKALDSLPASGR
ncbi:aminotransferase class I/II-fold pyridoxal phosphate-dependent enzyme [Streptosporangium sp. NBC_01755]|uniref:trans-sulfuration enzyme family protein n=1 Tax=unclassified Streptosporangium TaxID=2632669 RepID=UPI002DDA8213|nr:MULTISPECIES: aminotransferase class I/II-fold pyridoxal phosphate-dependent enzyme [unclassified Streptosporangium]WSA26560.1 aminotransferase class I/II-fold pyridoxal phosphate-dependent enzyme [Streptosporangium sp. NBC_01810]WSD02017.1 aminotransferase class I/II-fold pyridoxal phosphate-dependent enzyme [Streptosporangium sp. NBC_01755]